MYKIEKNILTLCPGCDAAVSFKKAPAMGTRIVCGMCDALLEVVATAPIELDWAFEDPDDDDDYDYDDDDYDYDDDDDDYDNEED